MKIINVAFIFAKTNSVHLKTLKIVSKTVFMNLNIEIYTWMIFLVTLIDFFLFDLFILPSFFLVSLLMAELQDLRH